MINEINNYCEKLIAIINKEALPNGSFLSYTADNPDFKKAKTTNAIFATCLILSSLSEIKSKNIKEVKKKTTEFLLTQKSDYWSFNYWKRNSIETKSTPYPDDLDDTFCALAGLYKSKPGLFNGATLAKIVMLLTATEKHEGGPYYTWLVPKNAKKGWFDIDLAVNSNIGYFLFLNQIKLKNIYLLIEEAIKNKNFSSPYYATPYSVIYFISRFYRGKKKIKIINFLLDKIDLQGKVNNPLDTALVVCALLNFNSKDKKIENCINYLLSNKFEKLNYSYPFVIELIAKKKNFISGSPALTSAFCLEALQKYQGSITKKNSKNKNVDPQGKKYLKLITKAVNERFSLLDKSLREQSYQILHKIIKADSSHQIALNSYYFQQSLNVPSDPETKEIILKTGIANVYGWMAYSIYDDFIDNEASPQLLPIANIYFRELINIYNNLLIKDKKFHQFLNKILDQIESTNYWETINCRAKIYRTKLILPNKLPDYDNYYKLSSRSIGHVLGPATILFSLGYNENSLILQNLISFFHHYLVAKQLNDDAHDWKDDLKKGNLTPVVIKTLQLYYGKNKITDVNLEKALEKIETIFWNRVIPTISKEILDQIQLAKSKLKEIKIIKKPQFIHQFLNPIEISAKKTLKEQKNAIEFINTFS